MTVRQEIARLERKKKILEISIDSGWVSALILPILMIQVLPWWIAVCSALVIPVVWSGVIAPRMWYRHQWKSEALDARLYYEWQKRVMSDPEKVLRGIENYLRLYCKGFREVNGIVVDAIQQLITNHGLPGDEGYPASTVLVAHVAPGFSKTPELERDVRTVFRALFSGQDRRFYWSYHVEKMIRAPMPADFDIELPPAPSSHRDTLSRDLVDGIAGHP